MCIAKTRNEMRVASEIETFLPHRVTRISHVVFCYYDGMRIVSWNVNGLRALHKKGYWEQLCAEIPFDVLCLQETKADPSQLPPELRAPEGLNAFFSSSQVKKGYSGVAVYTKTAPDKVEYGLGEERFDAEGRVITSYFGKVAVINVYVPNGGQGPHRIEFKMDFLDALLEKMNGLRTQEFGIVVCGDINIAHEAIDLARPEANEENTGFLPEERAWVDEVLAQGFVDIWRQHNPDTRDVYTYWDQRFGARQRNVGWRIDYFLVSQDLVGKVKKTSILGDVFGSDHCPVSLEI